MGKKISIEEWQNIVDTENINIDILSEVHKGRHRHLICRCRKCGQKFERDACRDSMLRQCWYCLGRAVIPNETDMATTSPWMIKYLKDKSLATKIKAKSDLKITFKCPDCGVEKDSIVRDICKGGFSCPICSDGISKPNKFLRALLSQLPIDIIDYEYSSEWTNNKKYDGYFEYNNHKYVIEMDGEQHKRTTTWSTKEEQEANDKYKDELANNNDVYILRIDAPTYLYDYWIKQFKESILAELFDLSDVDWNKCIEISENNLLKEICDFYNKNTDATLTAISKEFHIHAITIAKYLTIGATLGWCNYSKQESKKRSDRFNSKRIGIKNVILDSDDNIIKKCDTITDCAKQLSILCNRPINRDSVRSWFRRGKEFAIFDNYRVKIIK